MKTDSSRHKKIKKNKINSLEKNSKIENQESISTDNNIRNNNLEKQINDKNEVINEHKNKNVPTHQDNEINSNDEQVISLDKHYQTNSTIMPKLNREDLQKDNTFETFGAEEVESKKLENLTTTSVVEEEESDYVNPRGVRFIQDGPNGLNIANIPYGLPCLRELMRFLISLISSKNSELMITMGLNLITIGKKNLFIIFTIILD